METPVETPAPPPSAPLCLGPTVIALGVVSLLTDISSEMIYTQVPIFLKTVLRTSTEYIGLIEGVAESTASLLRVVAGWISDRMGARKPITILGYSLGAVSKPILALSTFWGMVLGARFLDRIGKGLRSAPRDALIAETTPVPIRGRAFGLHRAMDSTGAVLGPLLGLWLLSVVSGNLEHKLRALFLFAALPVLLAVITLVVAVREPRKPPDPEKSAEPLPFPRWRDLQPTYRRFLLAAFLFYVGNSSDAFLILRASTLGFQTRELLLMYAAFNGVETLLGYAAGRLSDRVGRRPMILTGYVVFALVYLGFALARSHWQIWVLFLVYGGYYTLTQGAQRAFAADFADPSQRATQIGAYYTVVGVALLPASLIAGWLFQINPAFPFFLGAAMAVLSILVLLTLPNPSAA